MKDCLCTAASKDPSCAMEREIKSEPRMFERRIDSGASDGGNEICDELPPLFSEVTSSQTRRKKVKDTRALAKQRMASDDSFMLNSRAPQKRFSALSIGGTMLTEYAIGGYEIDLGEVADAAREVVPLPPSQLPVIFADQELNFYHHFFRALRDTLGDELMQFLLSKDCSDLGDDTPLSDMVEDLVEAGYEKSDDEFQILLKKIISTTFSLEGQRGRKIRSGPIRVRANLWGFQYIEAGMRCDESDLEMWMGMSYMYYRTSWFNTFKLTGIPDFAVEAEMRKLGRYKRNTRKSDFSEGLRLLEPAPLPRVDHSKPAEDLRSRYGESMRSNHTHRRHQSGARWIKKKSTEEK